jgi:hypothetical protein
MGAFGVGHLGSYLYIGHFSRSLNRSNLCNLGIWWAFGVVSIHWTFLLFISAERLPEKTSPQKTLKFPLLSSSNPVYKSQIWGRVRFWVASVHWTFLLFNSAVRLPEKTFNGHLGRSSQRLSQQKSFPRPHAG